MHGASPSALAETVAPEQAQKLSESEAEILARKPSSSTVMKLEPGDAKEHALLPRRPATASAPAATGDAPPNLEEAKRWLEARSCEPGL